MRRSKIAPLRLGHDNFYMTKISTTKDQFPGAQSTGSGALRNCQWRGCAEGGIHKAPQDPSLSNYYFFCLEHIRLYNAQWNYHQGVAPNDMEVEFRSAATWDRPKWKMGERRAPGRPWRKVDDPFDLYREATEGAGNNGYHQPKASSEETKARRTLGLVGAITMETLKARYKELAKRYHPDTNGGSTASEDRLKTINAAYQTLRTALTQTSE